MDGSSFYSYVLQVLKRTDKSDETYMAMADTVMDMRARMISDEHAKISAALTGISAVGDYTLTIPTDYGHLVGDILIKDTSSDDVYLPLKKITKPEYDQMFNMNLATTAGNRHIGTPSHYCFYGQAIYLGPAVDKTTYEFKMNYTTEDTPTFTSATASIPFTDQFREVVRAGVLFRMFRELEYYDASSFWMNEYEKGINKIIVNDEANTHGSSSAMAYSGI